MYFFVGGLIGIAIGIGIATSSIVVDLFKGVHVFRRGRPGPVVQVGRGLIPSRVSKGQSLGEAVITTRFLAVVNVV